MHNAADAPASISLVLVAIAAPPNSPTTLASAGGPSPACSEHLSNCGAVLVELRRRLDSFGLHAIEAHRGAYRMPAAAPRFHGDDEAQMAHLRICDDLVDAMDR